MRSLPDLVVALRGRPAPAERTGVRPPGFFLVLEGGEGAGKSTLLRLLQEWVEDRGHEVVVTREPGGTRLGHWLREILLDPETADLVPEAEALLYAADRAQHVGTVVRPALERGAVVISDRYIDSSLAYQGAGRELLADDIARLSEWATRRLVPDLTVVLDVPPEVGAARRAARDGGAADRLEAEPEEFHARVRQGFLDLAAAAPERYLVVDATAPLDEVSEHVKVRLRTALPLSAREIEEQEEARRVEAARLAEERRQAELRRRAAVEARRRAEAERVRREQERHDAALQEAQRVAALEARARAEAERLEAERREAERIEAERLEAERREAERLEAERLEAERREAERLEAERVEAERREAERLEAERLEAERREAERLEARRREAERLDARRREAERREAETQAIPLAAVRERRERGTGRKHQPPHDATRELDLTDELFSWGQDEEPTAAVPDDTTPSTRNDDDRPERRARRQVRRR